MSIQLYPFGLSENDNILPTVDDGSSDPITLPESFRFYGQAIRIAYVS